MDNRLLALRHNAATNHGCNLELEDLKSPYFWMINYYSQLISQCTPKKI